MEFGWGDKIAPRFGFAYDVKGDGITKLYGSYGVFFDTMSSRCRAARGVARSGSATSTPSTADWPSIDCRTTSVATAPAATLIESINFLHTSNEPGSEIGRSIRTSSRPEARVPSVSIASSRPHVVRRPLRHKGWDETIDDIGVWTPTSQVCGEVYNIANPGKGIGKSPITSAGPSPTVPEVDNVYDGIEFVVRKRYQQLAGDEPPVLSGLYGNYGGCRSDETGRQAPNVSRYYDSLFLSFTEKGTEAIGRLNTDRPVQFRLQGAYTTPWGTNVGLNFYAFSGLLQSRRSSLRVFRFTSRAAATSVVPRCSTRPICWSRTISSYSEAADRRAGEHHEPVRPGNGHRGRDCGIPDAMVIPGFDNRVAEGSFQPGGIDVFAIQAPRLPNSERPSPLYKLDSGGWARSIRPGRSSFDL